MWFSSTRQLTGDMGFIQWLEVCVCCLVIIKSARGMRPEDCKNGIILHEECICSPGWEGHHCEHIQCLNGGSNGGHHHPDICHCTKNWTGKHCETSTILCSISSCFNGGHCYHDETHFYCVCPHGYDGIHCENKVDVPQSSALCSTSTCRHGGHCYHDNSTYTCVCPYPYSGTNCGTINICASKPCRNFGHCLQEGQSYFCHCTTGFTGVNCELNVTTVSTTTAAPVDICSYNPCVNGMCKNENSGYNCYCQVGYTGQHCEISLFQPSTTPTITGCSSNPCMNSGQCYDNGMQYMCDCQSGFEGSRCENVMVQTTTSATVSNLKTCESADLIKAFAFGNRVDDTQARPCPSNNKSQSDAVLIQYCQAPPTSSWTLMQSGKISNNCHRLQEFTAIAQFHHDQPTLKTGLFLKCNGTDNFQYLTQSCDSGLHVEHISWPESETFFAVDWV